MKLIYYRSDRKYWEARYYLSGQRRRIKLPFTEKSQKKEAKEFAKELYFKDVRGDILQECKTTFKEMADIYLSNGNRADVSKNYRLDIIYKFIGDRTLDKITYIDLEKIKNHLRNKRKVKNQTINRYFSDIRAILNLAKRKRIIKDFVPIDKLKAEERREARALTDDEIQKIHSALPEYLKDPFMFALSTGWRKANLVGLTRAHLSKGINGTYKVCFKAKEMKRRVPFEHYCTKEETDIINRNISIKDPYIFRREVKVNGTKTTRLGDFKKSIIRSRKETGIYWTWHWLRHTRATRYAKMKINQQQANKLMAWSPRSRMWGNYEHLGEEHLSHLRQDLENIGHHMDTKTDNGNF